LDAFQNHEPLGFQAFAIGFDRVELAIPFGCGNLIRFSSSRSVPDPEDGALHRLAPSETRFLARWPRIAPWPIRAAIQGLAKRETAH